MTELDKKMLWAFAETANEPATPNVASDWLAERGVHTESRPANEALFWLRDAGRLIQQAEQLGRPWRDGRTRYGRSFRKSAYRWQRFAWLALSLSDSASQALSQARYVLTGPATLPGSVARRLAPDREWTSRPTLADVLATLGEQTEVMIAALELIGDHHTVRKLKKEIEHEHVRGSQTKTK